MSSLSASAENLTNSDTQSNDGSSMCLELALEGERLCKSGDCRAGVAFFQAAIQAGTDDLRTLSAIYSQLGNAFFYLGDYAKAMQYHKLDLTLARSMDDKLGEAKSSGNLGNTLKVMGRFDEAAICCDRHLNLARQLGDRLSEGRALYNLGNVYHAKGKHMGQTDPGDFSDDVKDALIKAVEFYQQNLSLMKDLGDRGAQGRACGNLGNTYYLLGDFESAIEHHQERLRIAREFGDKPAERRANSNLGNSHIFLGQFEQAADHYKRTLSLAVDLGERAVEAQACYSLGNTYTLLRDFVTAIDYHQRHLAIAQELGDKVGEARACWSLGNAHSSIGNNEKALNFAELHYTLAKELGDSVGESTARMNVSDLRKMLGLPDFDVDVGDSVSIVSLSTAELRSNIGGSDSDIHQPETHVVNNSSSRYFRLTPDGKRLAGQPITTDEEALNENSKNPSYGQMEDDFFDMLTKSQSKRMDDQRCSLKVMGIAGGGASKDASNIRKPLIQQNSLPTTGVSAVPKENRNALLEMIADLQSERMDEQRAQLPGLVNRRQQPATVFAGTSASSSNDSPSNSSRLEEQRSELPRPSVTMDVENGEANHRRANGASSNIGATVPDEDFFSLIMRVQGGRMEDQRAASNRPRRKAEIVATIAASRAAAAAAKAAEKPSLHEMTIKQILALDTPMLEEHQEKFRSFNTVSERVRFCEEILRHYDCEPKHNKELYRLEKDNDNSCKHRESAKENLNRRNYRAAFANANTGVCYGKSSDYVAESYATRAEVYYELQMNEFCLDSIALTLAEGGYSKKTEQRVNIMSAVSERRVEEEEKKPKKQLRPTQKQYKPKMHFQANENNPLVDNCLQLEYSPDFGRYVVSSKSMGTGKILAYDEAICPTMTVEGRRLRCSNCFNENGFALIPCQHCTSALFCNNEGGCYDKAMESFHRFECPIIDFLYDQPEYRNVVRMIVTAFRRPEDIDDYIEFTKRENISLYNAFSMDFKNLERNYGAKLAYTLETNEGKRSEEEKFTFSRRAAHLIMVMREKTTIISELFLNDKHLDFLREFCYRQLQIVCVNGRVQQNSSSVRFTSETQQQKTFAHALFPLLSLFNHNCKANVAALGYGLNSQVLFTVRPIKKGEQLFMDYVYGYHAEWRQKVLEDVHFYQCSCYKNPLSLGYLNKESEYTGMIIDCKLSTMGRLYLDEIDVTLSLLSKVGKYITKHDNRYPNYELYVNRKALDLCFERMLGYPIEFDFGAEVKIDPTAGGSDANRPSTSRGNISDTESTTSTRKSTKKKQQSQDAQQMEKIEESQVTETGTVAERTKKSKKKKKASQSAQSELESSVSTVVQSLSQQSLRDDTEVDGASSQQPSQDETLSEPLGESSPQPSTSKGPTKTQASAGESSKSAAKTKSKKGRKRK